ncbi:MAG TPA: DnaB-like helicase C-terminal domain-containing protein [Spirochaetota bacterium]|nr:DnaB-like helicase C-terminal domain-containing protein [Spirochaetota bacterium]
MKQDLTEKIKNLINQPDIDENEVIFQLKKLLYDNDLKKLAPRDTISLSELLSEKLSEIKNPMVAETIIKTGIESLDRALCGFALGELVVLGGRPAMGKTQLLIYLSMKFSRTIPVLYFSFDYSMSMLKNRYVSIMAQVATDRLMRGDLELDEKEMIIHQVEKKLNTYKIFINDGCSDSVSLLRAHCQKQIAENGVKVIIIDYLQLMSHPRLRYNRELEISYITRELKNMAREFNVCVIVASQLSREAERRPGCKRPILSDLRDSGAIEQDADKVIFIYRPEYYCIEEDEFGNSTTRMLELIIAKNRTGSSAEIKLRHGNGFTSFEDVEETPDEFTFDKNRQDEINMPPF